MRDDRVLARVVRPHERRGHEPGDRRGVHDVRLGLLHEQRDERANPVDHAPQVHPEHPLPGRERGLPRQSAAADARVVAEDVHAAEPLDRRVGQRLHLRGIGDVGEHPIDLGAGVQLRHRSFQRVGLHIAEHDVRTFRGEPLRERESDPAGSAGDDRDFSLEILHGSDRNARPVQSSCVISTADQYR